MDLIIIIHFQQKIENFFIDLLKVTLNISGRGLQSRAEQLEGTRLIQTHDVLTTSF